MTGSRLCFLVFAASVKTTLRKVHMGDVVFTKNNNILVNGSPIIYSFTDSVINSLSL
jgi:hypothetical protein